MAYVANTSVQPLLQSMQRNAELAEARRIANQQARAQRIAAASQIIGTVGGAVAGGFAGGGSPQMISQGAMLGGTLGQTVGGLAGGKAGAPIALQGGVNFTNAAAQSIGPIMEEKQKNSAVAAIAAQYPGVPAAQQAIAPIEATQAAPQAANIEAMLAQAPQRAPAEQAPAPQQVQAPAPQGVEPLRLAQRPQTTAMPAQQQMPQQQMPQQAVQRPAPQGMNLTAPDLDALLGMPAPIHSEIPAEYRSRRQQRQMNRDIEARLPYHEMARELAIKSYFARPSDGGLSVAERERLIDYKTGADIQKERVTQQIKLEGEAAAAELKSKDPAALQDTRDKITAKLMQFNADIQPITEVGENAIRYADTTSRIRSRIAAGTVTSADDFMALGTTAQAARTGAANATDGLAVSGNANSIGYKLLEASMGASDASQALFQQLRLGNADGVRAEALKFGISVPEQGRLFTDDVTLGLIDVIDSAAETEFARYERNIKEFERTYWRPYTTPISKDPRAPMEVYPNALSYQLETRKASFNRLRGRNTQPTNSDVDVNIDDVETGDQLPSLGGK